MQHFKAREREYAEALRGILRNTGLQGKRNGVALRQGMAQNKYSCKDFHTFSPKAIAGIGKLPDNTSWTGRLWSR